MKLTLERDSHPPKQGSFGVLTLDGKKFQTVEQDWENNKPYHSCIPNGTYELHPHESPSKGACYILVNEKLGVGKYEGDAKRFGCLIHIANKASQLQGCIAPGKLRTMLDGEWAVGSSGNAMRAITKILGREEVHSLTIKSKFPTFKVK